MIDFTTPALAQNSKVVMIFSYPVSPVKPPLLNVIKQDNTLIFYSPETLSVSSLKTVYELAEGRFVNPLSGKVKPKCSVFYRDQLSSPFYELSSLKDFMLSEQLKTEEINL